jgi:ESCRT-II complex subunit VPS22
MSHLRRGVGVGRNPNLKIAAQKKADEIKAVSLSSAIATVEKLETKLTEYAKIHRNEILNDPIFRHSFLKMCAPLGVDVLSSKKTVLGNLLGMGDFYYELAVKVAEVCFATRNKNGGIISIKEIQHTLLNRTTKRGITKKQHSGAGGTTTTTAPNRAISINDIQVAISKLSVLGGGFRTVTVGPSMIMVISVPTELDNDHMTLMSLAAVEQQSSSDDGKQQQQQQGITVRKIQDHTGWSKERIDRAILLLLQEGMVWVDTYKHIDYYWFTSIWQEQQQQSQQ